MSPASSSEDDLEEEKPVASKKEDKNLKPIEKDEIIEQEDKSNIDTLRPKP